MKVDIKMALIKAKGEKVSGSVFVRSFDYRMTTKNEPFVYGYIGDQGFSIGFRAWNEMFEEFRSC